MDKIAVLIPCYNESMTIQKVVTDFKMALPDAKIYVYDNNSSDNTACLQHRQEQLSAMSLSKEKEMLSDACFKKLTHIAIF